MLLANIKRFIKKSSVLFAVFIITQTISVIAVQYSFFNYREQKIEYDTYSRGMASFKVIFNEGTAYKDIKDTVAHIQNTVSVPLKQCYIVLTDEYEARAYIFGQFQAVLYGESFENNTEVVIGHSLYEQKQIKIDDKLEISGKPYTVSGVRLFDYNEIPYQSLSDDVQVAAIVTETQIIPDKNQISEIQRDLENAFPEGGVAAPYPRDMLSEYSVDGEMLTAYVLFALAMINITYAFNAVIQKRRFYYAVSLCCGSTFSKMRLSLVLESLIYGLASVVVGTFIFNTVLINILFPENRFSFFDYFISVLWSLGLLTVPVVGSLIGFSSKTVKQLIYGR